MAASIEKIMDRLVTWGGVCGAVSMAVVMVIIVMDVIGRFIGYALPGTFDLVETIMIIACAYSLVYCQMRDRHAKADVLLTRLPPRAQSIFQAFTTFLSIGLWGVFVWAGVVMFVSKWQRGEQTDILRISVLPFRFLWVVSLILMLIILVIRFVTKVREGASK